jgi:hypothetical protein
MSESEVKPPGWRLPYFLLALAVVLLLAVGAFFLWRRFDPFLDQQPAFREAQALQAAVRGRPLDADEFAACLRLCEQAEGPAQQSAIASLEAAVGRSPEFREQAVEALGRVAARRDAQASASAKAVLKRLESTPR